MACPEGARFTADMFRTAMENFDLWEATFCAYGSPLGELTVGTVVYSAVGLNIFLRTGSIMIPFVLALVLGGTILAQMFAIINAFVGLLILFGAPLVASMLIFAVDRRG